MITQELEALLPLLESDSVEKTISVTNMDKFGEAICAFSNDLAGNNKPGYLIIGAHDDGTLAGLNITEDFIQTLLGYRTDGRTVPPPALIVRKYQFSTGDVAVVEVNLLMCHQYVIKEGFGLEWDSERE